MDWKEKEMTQDARVEQMERRVREYMLNVKDRQFMDYLQKMQIRLKTQQHQVEILEAELDRSYQMYINRMSVAGIEISSGESTNSALAAAGKGEQHQKQNGSSAEFVVGSILLSIVGGAFILAALVMLGRYYMNAFAKGICFYAVFVILLAASELVLYRKIPKLGLVLTAISIGGLHLTTMLNYRIFNFNVWIAWAIALMITIMSAWLSWKRDSALYRIIGLTAVYIWVMILKDVGTDTERIAAAIITLLINLMCIMVPLQCHKKGFRMLQMYENGIFTLVICCLQYNYSDNDVSRLLFIGFAWLLLHMLLILLIRGSKQEAVNQYAIPNCGILAGYYVSGILIYASLPEGVMNLEFCRGILHFGGFAVMLIIAAVSMLFLTKKGAVRGPYFLMNYAAFSMFFLYGTRWESILGIVSLLLLSKAVTTVSKVISLRVWDAVLTGITCLLCLAYIKEPMEYTIVLLAAVLISIPFISYWQTYYEIMITFTLAIFAAAKLPFFLQLSAFTGIMFVSILVYNHVKRWQGRHILLFNGAAVAGQVISFLLLMNPIYQNAYVVYLCMLIFGLATIVLTFQEKYRMNFQGKNVILAIFLTYMALIIRTDVPVINSILMMVIALICVGLGFYEKEKKIRIYGLVLSLIVCGKIAVYDFFDAKILQKMILFFTVGVIALLIAGIYIVLERKMNIQQTNGGEG